MSSIFRMLSHARMFRTRAAALIALVGMITASTGLVVLSSSSASATSEVGLCHATGSDTSPYTFQSVDKSSTTYQGHYDHYLHPQETWHDGTWWNGVWHPAGTPKGDLIDGVTGHVDQALCAQNGTGAITVTPGVTFTDPTCAGTLAGWSGANGDKIVYAVTSGQVAAGKSVTIGATPKPGYEFAKTATTTFSHTYPTPDCSSSQVIGLPGSPSVNAPSCTSDGSFTLPTSPVHVTWTSTGTPVDGVYGPGSYTVTATADQGYQFSDGSTSKTWTVVVEPELTGLTCATQIPVPSAPVPTPATCGVDGSLTLPATTHVLWVVGNDAPAAGPISLGKGTYHVVAQAADGYKFAGDVTTHDYGSIKVDAASGDCPQQATAVPPTVTVSTQCGVEGSYTIPATAGVQYLLDGSPVAAGTHSGPVTGTVTAVGLGNTVLTNTGFSFDLVVPPAVQCPPGTTEVTPAAPTFVDPTCAHPDGAAAVYQDTEAVDYSQTGTVGLGGTVTVTAVPRTGFTFPAGAVASWSHSYPKGVVCATETSKPKPSHAPTVKPTQATGHHHPSRRPTVLGTQAVAVPTAVDAGLATWNGDSSSPSGTLLGESLVAAGLVLLLAGAALGLGRRRRGEHQV